MIGDRFSVHWSVNVFFQVSLHMLIIIIVVRLVCAHVCVPISLAAEQVR